MIPSEALARAHDAIGGLLDHGDRAVAWVLTVDVTGPDGERRMAHRSATAVDGTVPLPPWIALGMLRASTDRADAELQRQTAQAVAAEDAFPPTFGA